MLLLKSYDRNMKYAFYKFKCWNNSDLKINFGESLFTLDLKKLSAEWFSSH